MRLFLLVLLFTLPGLKATYLTAEEVVFTTAATDGYSTRSIIQHWQPVAQDVVSAVELTDFNATEFTAADGTVLRYRVLAPLHIEPGKLYPLVLQLHGSGGIGTDNLKQLDKLAKGWALPDIRERYPAYVLIPQFPIRSANYGPPSAEQHATHSSALVAAVELVEDFTLRYAVDKNRIYAVGFSMGGSASWLAPTLKPDLFAAIMPISGVAPASEFASNFKNLPVLVIHGNADTENPITADRRFISEITHLGGEQILLREYDGLAHRLAADLFPGYWWRDWLFRQSRK